MRPLKYTSKQRKDLYASYVALRNAKTLTKEQYVRKIERLNKNEQKAREVAIKKKKVGLERQMRNKITTQRQKYLDSFGLKKVKEQERFGHINAVTYAFEPIIQLSNVDTTQVEVSDLIQVATSLILDNIDYTYTKGKCVISIQTSAKKNMLDLDKSNWSLGKAFSTPIKPDQVLQRIIYKINEAVNKSIASNVTVFLESVTYTYIDSPESGACDSDKHNTSYGALKIMSPKSTKNNCLFACIHHFLKKRMYAETIRNLLNLPKETAINISDLDKIARFYDICIELFDLNAEPVGTYGDDTKQKCPIMLFVCSKTGLGHYVLIVGNTKTCEECGKYYVKTHKCNLRRQMWLNRMSGGRIVIPTSVEKETEPTTNDLIFFDLETFKPEGTDRITPYASAWWCEGKYYQSYGEKSWTDFYEFLKTQKNKKVCAYNGAGFDFHFLMSELLSEGVEIKNVILSGGRLMTFGFGDNMRCWDICLFTLSSLKDACKSFGVSQANAKTEFEHSKIQSWSDVYKYRSEVEPYIEKDVLSLKEVYQNYSTMLYSIFKCHMTDFVTLSSMSYALWTGSVNAMLELPDTDKYNFIRKSLYGGRTYPQQREYTSEHYNDIVNSSSVEERKQIYKNMTDWIFNGDATSLYPYCMVAFKYPCGISKWVEGDKIDVNNLGIGIYDVEVECNKDLIVPILPEKTENGGISWNLRTKRGVYTTADLENAVKYGYKITKAYKGLKYPQEAEVFKDYIMKCYKIKEENDDNPVLRQIGKILMNALYGKMLERARFEETSLCNNIGDVWKFQTKFIMSDVLFIKDKVVAIGMPIDEEVSDKRIRKPSQIGTFILSYSRRHMLNIMSAIEPNLDKHFFTYTDTDSLHIKADTLPILEQKGWLSKGLGQLSDDAKGGRIFREVNLAPKLYMYLCLMPNGDVKTCMKSKGIPAQYLSPHLFNEADSLEDDEKVIQMPSRLKKVGLGRNLQIDWRKYDAFSILSVDMERTFYKNMWKGMDYVDGKFYPKLT